jgi:hypothetical protein
MRRTHYTILLVCEGYAEHEFARVIRDLYLPRDCGTTIQPKNARRGTPYALELAIQLRTQGHYNEYALIVDTDQHWDSAARARAQANGIVVIENAPCLEATLLKVDGQQSYQSTSDNKVAFEARYGGPPHRDGVIRRHFPRSKFDTARAHVAAIERLLTLIRC